MARLWFMRRPDGKWPAFGLCGGFEGDVVSACFELFDEALGCALGVAVGVVVAAGFAVELAGCEHVPAGGDDGVFDGSERAAVAAAGAEALVLGGEVDVVGAGGGHGCFGEGGVEPLAAVAGVAGGGLAGGGGGAGAPGRPRGW